MTAFVVLLCGIFGLLVGSFLNVVIWRVPRKESIAFPASHCPACDSPIAVKDNLPVLSWVALRGRCRSCTAPIPARYPAVEVTNAVLWALVGARFWDSWALPAYLVFTAALVAISVIDLEHYIIPNRIVYPVGFTLVPLFAFASLMEDDWGALFRALAGAVAAFSVLYLIHVISPRGMGFGDVRLSALLGLALGWLGWGSVAFGMFLGFVYGAVLGVALIAAGLRSRRQHIPFGPFLAAGAMTMVLVGAPILDWYSSLNG